MNPDSIYETQACRLCGMPHNDVMSISPNGTFWHHKDTEACLRATACELRKVRKEMEETRELVMRAAPYLDPT